MTKLYRATVTVRIAVEERDKGNALLRALEVADELAKAMPTGARFSAINRDEEIARTLKQV